MPVDCLMKKAGSHGGEELGIERPGVMGFAVHLALLNAAERIAGTAVGRFPRAGRVRAPGDALRLGLCPQRGSSTRLITIFTVGPIEAGGLPSRWARSRTSAIPPITIAAVSRSTGSTPA